MAFTTTRVPLIMPKRVALGLMGDSDELTSSVDSGAVFPLSYLDSSDEWASGDSPSSNDSGTELDLHACHGCELYGALMCALDEDEVDAKRFCALLRRVDRTPRPPIFLRTSIDADVLDSADHGGCGKCRKRKLPVLRFLKFFFCAPVIGRTHCDVSKSEVFITDPNPEEPSEGAVDFGMLLRSVKYRDVIRHFSTITFPGDGQGSLAEGFEIKDNDELLMIGKTILIDKSHEDVLACFLELQTQTDVSVTFRRHVPKRKDHETPRFEYIQVVAKVVEVPSEEDIVCPDDSEIYKVRRESVLRVEASRGNRARIFQGMDTKLLSSFVSPTQSLCMDDRSISMAQGGPNVPASHVDVIRYIDLDAVSSGAGISAWVQLRRHQESSRGYHDFLTATSKSVSKQTCPVTEQGGAENPPEEVWLSPQSLDASQDVYCFELAVASGVFLYPNGRKLSVLSDENGLDDDRIRFNIHKVQPKS